MGRFDKFLYLVESLEAQRKAPYQKLEELGGFRRGTLSVNYRKCGRKNCACAKPGKHYVVE